LALAAMTITISISISLLRDDLRLQLTVLAAALIGLWVVWRIPTRADPSTLQVDKSKPADTPDGQ
jgi:hypothetical protein